MDIKQVARLVGATVLTAIPVAGGFAAYGSMKDKKVGNLGSGVAAGFATLGLGLGVGLLNYYILGLDDVVSQLQTVMPEKSSNVGLLSVNRSLGLLNVQRKPSHLGLVNISRDVAGCYGCAPRFS